MYNMLNFIDAAIAVVFYEDLWSGSTEEDHKDCAEAHAWFLHNNDTVIIEVDNLHIHAGGWFDLTGDFFIKVLGLTEGYHTLGHYPLPDVVMGRWNDLWHVITIMDGVFLCRLWEEDWDDDSMIGETKEDLFDHSSNKCRECWKAIISEDERRMRQSNTPTHDGGWMF